MPVMAMLKAFSQKWSLGSSSPGGGCLSWCFGLGQQRQPDRNEYLNPNDADALDDNSAPPPYSEPEAGTAFSNGGVALAEEAIAAGVTESEVHTKESPVEVKRRLSSHSSHKGSPILEMRRSKEGSRKCKDVPDGEVSTHKRTGSRSSDVTLKRTLSKASAKSGSHLKELTTSNNATGSEAITVTDSSAYAYEDAETSSDSDDEVLRRYQQTMGMQRVPSKHSIRSSKSTKSAKSATSRTSKKSKTSPVVVESTKNTSSSTRDGDRLSLAEQGKGAQPSEGNEEDEQLVPGTSMVHEYQNDAYSDEAIATGDGISEQHSAAFNDTASMSIGDPEQDEHLFDVSDLQDRDQPIISKCGNLKVSFAYSYEKARMSITVHQAFEIPSKDRGGANNSQIRLLLLPTKKIKNKTKIRTGENPEFNESFTMKVPPEEINNMGVRFRLYGCERMRRERMIGESVVGFASLNQDEETTHMLTLEPRSNLSHGDSNMDVASLSRSDSASSTQSMQHGGMPELLVGLTYNGTTGRLCVEVIKGSNFRNMAMNRAPDTYVKLTLMSPTGQEIARSKTSIRRGQPNPLYKETFMFQVALFQLPEVTLMTSVYNKRSMKRKEMIGWFSLGKNNSGEEELAHWNDMRESKGEQVCRWHVLLES